jgi:hypothetical protein
MQASSRRHRYKHPLLVIRWTSSEPCAIHPSPTPSLFPNESSATCYLAVEAPQRKIALDTGSAYSAISVPALPPAHSDETAPPKLLYNPKLNARSAKLGVCQNSNTKWASHREFSSSQNSGILESILEDRLLHRGEHQSDIRRVSSLCKTVPISTARIQ